MEWVKTEWVVPRMGFYFLPEAEGPPHHDFLGHPTAA